MMKRLLISAMLLSMPAMAQDLNIGNATVNDFGSASLIKDTAKKAQIGINENTTTIQWERLNVNKGKTLDFKFSETGQTAINEVATGVSTFAGKVSSSGKVGQVIISNPNGIVIEKGAKIVIPGGLKLEANIGNIEIGKATIKAAKSAVEFNGANISLDGTKVTTKEGLYLYSTDGVNFVNKVKTGTIVVQSDTEFHGVKAKAIKTDNTYGEISNIYIGDKSAIKGTKNAQTNIVADTVTIENSKISGVKTAKANIETTILNINNSKFNNSALAVTGDWDDDSYHFLGECNIDSKSVLKNTNVQFVVDFDNSPM
jgi:filamentous hemagglutinin family protein